MTDVTTQQIIELLDGFSGQQNTLFIPRLYLAACDNDHVAALFLNQCMYWSKRGDKEGWFAKSHEDWLKELGMSEFQVRRSVKALEAFGLETKVRRSKYYQGKTAVHYRVDRKRVLETLLSKLSIGKLTNFGSMGSEETKVPFTENMSETTKNISPDALADYEREEQKSISVANDATGGDIHSSLKENSNPQTAKTKNQEPPPKVALKGSPKEPRQRDPIFDAVAEYIFGVTDPAIRLTMQPDETPEGKKQRKTTNTLVGIIKSWLKREIDYIPYGKSSKHVGYISEGEIKPEHVKQFAAWYHKKNPTASMVTDGEKFVNQWRKYASEINGRKQQTPRPVQKPARPNLTDEQKAARLAEMQQQRQGAIE